MYLARDLFRACMVIGLGGVCLSATAQLPPGFQLDVPAACRAEAVLLSERELSETLQIQHVKLAVELVGERYRAVVQTALGTRTLEGESCAAAVSAGLIFVALSVAQEPPAVQPTVAADGFEERELDEPASAIKAPRREPLTVATTGMALWGTGTLPGSGFGGGARASLGTGWWSGSLGLIGWGNRDAAASVAGTGGQFWLWSGLAAGCVARPRRSEGGAPIPFGSRVRPGACLGAELGRMHGEGTGVDLRHHARALWLSAFVEAQLRLQVHGGFSLFLSAQPQIALVRGRFRLDGAGLVHRPAQLAFNAGLGVAYEFSLAQ